MPTDNVLLETPLLKALPASLAIHSVRSGETLDYAELSRRVGAQAGAIADHLQDIDAPVVIGMSDPVKGLVALFAVWTAGHCAVLVNPKLAEDEKQRVIKKVTPGLWIDDDGVQKITDASAGTALGADAALVLMTSGTTGDPKGITHSLATLEARLKLNVEEIGPQVLERTFCPLPLFFGHGLIGNCLTPLYAGQSLFVLDTPSIGDFAEFGALIDRHRITFLSSVPSMWRMVLRVSPPPTLPPLRLHVGSAPLPEELWIDIERWCGTDQVFNTYGMTEAANWISGGTRPVGEPDGFVGAPWGGTFRVLRDGKLRDEGRGEVALTSPSMMLGLWGMPVQQDTKDGYFLTGDIGALAKDQTLRLVGRTKNEINRGGIKVLAEEVDMLLERHPDIAEACSFGIPDDMSGELVGAVIKLNEGAELKDTALFAWARDHARREAVPTRIAIVDEIVKNDRGKLDRKAVQKAMIAKWF